MKRYLVVQATGLMLNGQSASAWPGAVVQVDDEQGAALVAEGKLELVGKGDGASVPPSGVSTPPVAPKV